MRFFLDKQTIEQGVMFGDDAKHLRDVLRVKIGEEIVLCDEFQYDYVCKVTGINKSHIEYDIVRQEPNQNEPSTKITIYQGLPKSPKLDVIIQKAVEIGVYEIVLVETIRSIVKVKDVEKKLDRWQKISKSASMQSKRGIVPAVRYARFDDAILEADGHNLSLIAYENEGTLSLKQALANNNECSRIAIYIGPEGGFSEEEVHKATSQGLISVSLGKRILRTETAPLVMASQILYEYE